MPPAVDGAAPAEPPPPPLYCSSLFFRSPAERSAAPSLPPVSSLLFRAFYRHIGHGETEMVSCLGLSGKEPRGGARSLARSLSVVVVFRARQLPSHPPAPPNNNR